MEQVPQLSKVQPPESSVEAARAAFRLYNTKLFGEGQFNLATLHFDSSLEPLAAGVRGSHAVARQLLYKSGTVCIDMRMQRNPGSESILLIGQLLDSASPDQGIGGVPVSVLSKGHTVSHKQTNQDGEFDFGLDPSTDMQLVFGIDPSRTIVVSMPESEGTKKIM